MFHVTHFKQFEFNFFTRKLYFKTMKTVKTPFLNRDYVTWQLFGCIEQCCYYGTQALCNKPTITQSLWAKKAHLDFYLIFIMTIF